jgi:hypothetical protein
MISSAFSGIYLNINFTFLLVFWFDFVIFNYIIATTTILTGTVIGFKSLKLDMFFLGPVIMLAHQSIAGRSGPLAHKTPARYTNWQPVET